MATRFYLRDNNAPPGIAPSFDAGGQHEQALRRQLDTVKEATRLRSARASDRGPSAGQKALDRQYIGGPLAAQTIGGTVRAS